LNDRWFVVGVVGFFLSKRPQKEFAGNSGDKNSGSTTEQCQSAGNGSNSADKCGVSFLLSV
jgi:hypothetical protein